MKPVLPILILLLLPIGCNDKPKQDPETTKQGNTYTTISDDTAKLGRLIDLSFYKPTHVKFKYILHDNSGKGERITVPGPSDSRLEAVLYFDSAGFAELGQRYYGMDYASPGYDRQTFNFDWLDKEVRDELLNSDTGYFGHPGQIWLLHNKLLMIQNRN